MFIPYQTLTLRNQPQSPNQMLPLIHAYQHPQQTQSSKPRPKASNPIIPLTCKHYLTLHNYQIKYKGPPHLPYPLTFPTWDTPHITSWVTKRVFQTRMTVSQQHTKIPIIYIIPNHSQPRHIPHNPYNHQSIQFNPCFTLFQTSNSLPSIVSTYGTQHPKPTHLSQI